MSRVLPPAETLTIVGGPALTRVDADAVEGAAVLLDDAAERLRYASRRCAAVQGGLVRRTWVPDPAAPPFGAPAGRVATAAVLVAAADAAGTAAARLEIRAARVQRCARRLRLAAGLYRESESLAERAIGAAVGWYLAPLLGLVLADALVPFRAVAAGRRAAENLRGADASETRPVTPGLAADPPAPPTREVTGGGDGIAAGLWREAAPYADEAVAGLSVGLGGVTRGAGTLSDVVAGMLPTSRVRVLALTDDDLAGPPPAWTEQPSGTVGEALARTADLYPHGSGVVGRPGAGVPAGTLAVERVTHADGTASWTVLIPGTQGFLSSSNPFDAATDLDLMAHETADVSVAVEDALAHAGAAPDEPVVLVGHSLGGISATALAASPAFRAKHPVGGVVTAGSPTATFATPAGVPVLHLENDEELVSPVDGRSSEENPASVDRVTVGRRLLDSADPADLAASGSISLAHAMPTHLRTLAAARDSGNVQVAGVTGRLERLLEGSRAQTRFFTARRAAVVDPGPIVLAPGRSGPGTTTPPPGIPTGAALH